jgi:hypothetical protein
MANNKSNGEDRIEFLREKQKNIGAQLAAAVVLKRKREAVLTRKTYLAVGEAVVQTALENEGFGLMLRSTLGSVVTDPKVRRLLTDRGLL